MAGIIATLAVQLTCTVCAFMGTQTWQLRRGIRQARGHYLVSDDFDPESRALLARAQAWQEWEITQAPARRDGGSQALVTRRVEALERHAEEVRDADAAWSQHLEASEAGSAAESVALAEIEDLTESARRVRDAIQADLRGTGQHGSGPRGPRGAGR